MQLSDFTKDIQHLLLQHWTKSEIESRLEDPPYFFEHVVIPRLDYLRKSGETAPHLRLQQTPKGELRVILIG
ncbi:MAG: hypothetical protein LHV69_03625 [Elusimicrobia bacterium]|nr:hypothetical protein [Candidatus Obscuribacterium magneticum]